MANILTENVPLNIYLPLFDGKVAIMSNRYFLETFCMRSLSLILLLAIVLSGCAPGDTVRSSSIDPAEIYQEYDVSRGKYGTTAVAMFRVGGPGGQVIYLTADSQVEYNGILLKRDTRVYADTAGYTEYGAESRAENTFIFTDPAGKDYKNSVATDPILLETGPLTIDRSRDIMIKLSRPVKENETLSTTIGLMSRDPQDKTDRGRFVKLDGNFAEGRSSIIIRPEDLRGLASGKATISVMLKGEKPLDEGTPRGGRIKYDCESADIQTTVIN